MTQTMVLAGKPAADQIRESVCARVVSLNDAGVTPTLHLIRVGARDDDVAYQRGVLSSARKLGVRVSMDELPDTIGQADLESALLRANADPTVHAIMVFQPLPAGLNARRLNALIDPIKDVDGLSPANQALVYTGDPTGVPPCTPAAVLALLQHYQVNLKGARVTVVGRSMVVGKPVAMLLLSQHATVTICHSRTRDLIEACQQADVVVAALGKAKFLDARFFRAGQAVVDVGIHIDEHGTLVGDVDAESVAPVVAALAPAKGGVGSVTSAILFDHVVRAAERLAANTRADKGK